MGTWSHEPFGNDMAADWITELLESNDLSFFEETLDEVLDTPGYLEAPAAEAAIAAIEVMAKLLGKGTQSDASTEEMDAWITSQQYKPSAQLLQKAQRVLERILLSESELLELWSESDGTGWKASITAVQSAGRP